MGKTRDRLVDATRRLLAAGTGDDEAAKSLVEIGIGKAEAKSIVSEAKAMLSSNGQKKQQAKAADSFWDAPVGTYFGDLHDQKGEGVHKGLFSFLRWLAK